MFQAYFDFVKRTFFYVFGIKTESVQPKNDKEESLSENILADKQDNFIQAKPLGSIIEQKIEAKPESIKKVKSKPFKKKEKVSHKEIPTYSFIRVDDVPDDLERGIIYVVGEKGFEWLIAMVCPCGCNEQILLNTLKETRPCWRFVCYKSKSITISPSVHRLRNCRSHFTITKGELKWWGNPTNY
jgi:hypothetical protein